MVRWGWRLKIALRKSQQDLRVNLVYGLREREGLRMSTKFLSQSTCRIREFPFTDTGKTKEGAGFRGNQGFSFG